jgi:hypothetical protein
MMILQATAAVNVAEMQDDERAQRRHHSVTADADHLFAKACARVWTSPVVPTRFSFSTVVCNNRDELVAPAEAKILR